MALFLNQHPTRPPRPPHTQQTPIYPASHSLAKNFLHSLVESAGPNDFVPEPGSLALIGLGCLLLLRLKRHS